VSRAFPWYPWYADDFLGAVRGWSTLQRGGYRDALDAQWTLDGLPADPAELRKTIGLTPTEFRQVWPKIEAKFPVAEDGRRRNLRLELERTRGNKISEARSKVGKKGAARRWGADSNSHENAAAQDGNCHDFANGKTMPSTSTSTDSSPLPPPDGGGTDGLAPSAGRSPRPIQKRSAQAWDRVIEAARRGLGSIGDPEIDTAVRQIGGYQRIGQSNTDQTPQNRRRFRELYEGLINGR
jgi:uncharacterized protein YdaU (DUF1376 family)